jgi:hypothetical protein
MKNLLPKGCWIWLLSGLLLTLPLTYSHTYSEPNSPQFVSRHIVIAHDISGSVTRHPELLERIRRYLDALLFMGSGSIQLDRADHLDDISSFTKNTIWRAGDGITILTFGMEEGDIRDIPRENEENWVREFSNRLVSRHSYLYSVEEKEIRMNLKNILQSISHMNKNYTLSRYLFPFCLSKLPEEVYGKETILIVISDFRYGDDQHNIGDREVIIHFARRKLLDHLEERWSDLQKNFSLSPTVFNLNVGGRSGIFIQGKWITANPLLKGEFKSVPSVMHFSRLPDESSYFLPRIIFHRQDVSKWTTIQYMGVCGKSTTCSRFIYDAPFSKGNEVKIDGGKISIDQSKENDLKTAAFFVAGKHLKDIWRLGFYQESSPFIVDFSLKTRLPGIVTYGLAVFIFFIGLWLIFGRYRVVEAEFLPTGRRCEDHKGETCILFECDPLEKNEKALIPIFLKPKKDPFNLSRRARAIVHVEVSPKGNPFGVPVFKDNSKAELVIKRILPKSVREEIVLPLVNLKSSHLWDKGDDDREPFSIRLTIQNGHRQKAYLLFGLLVQRMGTLWLGLDPGTTGSCVYGGNTSDDIKPVPLPIPMTSESVFILPSTIFFTPEYSGSTKYPYIDSIRVGEPSPRGDDPNRIFFSFKRLVGYGNVRTFTTISGEEIKIRGEDVQSVIIDYLVMKAESFFKARPQQAVIVVPNSYTPAKIQLMKECCLKTRYLKRVEHIYEPEAILLYYYKKISIKATISLPITVLVIDFGGSTLNVAIATLKQERKKLIVNMHTRMGFNIGGDTITAILAEKVWNKQKEAFWEYLGENRSISVWKNKEFPSPFEEPSKILPDQKNSWESLRRHLWDYAEHKKKEKPLDKDFPNLTEGSETLIRDPLNHMLTEIESGIMEVVKIFNPNLDKPIHSIILAGRASLFDPISEIISKIKNEIVKKTKKEITEELIFDNESDRKLCVAEGAVFYGIQKENDNVWLTRNKTFAHYGMQRHTSPVKSEFKNIIPMGSEFSENNVTNDVKEIDLGYHGRSLSFYQIMSADPMQKNLPTYRKSEIQKFVLDQGENYLKLAKITLDTEDRCIIQIETNFKERKSEKYFRIEDISTEMDRYTTWRLI